MKTRPFSYVKKKAPIPRPLRKRVIGSVSTIFSKLMNPSSRKAFGGSDSLPVLPLLGLFDKAQKGGSMKAVESLVIGAAPFLGYTSELLFLRPIHNKYNLLDSSLVADSVPVLLESYLQLNDSELQEMIFNEIAEIISTATNEKGLEAKELLTRVFDCVNMYREPILESTQNDSLKQSLYLLSSWMDDQINQASAFQEGLDEEQN